MTNLFLGICVLTNAHIARIGCFGVITNHLYVLQYKQDIIYPQWNDGYIFQGSCSGSNFFFQRTWKPTMFYRIYDVNAGLVFP